MEKTGTIYLLQFPNGKTYVGQTWRFKKRMSQHKGAKDKTVVHSAIIKYGWDNVVVDILKDGLQTQEEMNTCETYYTNSYCSRVTQNGYNVREPGSRGRNSEETNRKVSEKKKGCQGWNKGKKLHYDVWNKGKIGIYSEELLKKMSETRKGKPAHNKGKKQTEEQRKENSERQKGEKSAWFGRKHTDESKRRIGIGNTGKKRPDLSERNRNRRINKTNEVKNAI